MTVVPRAAGELLSENCRVSKPTSFLDLGNPTNEQINWLSGYLLGGMRVNQNCDGASATTDPTYRFKTWRHPNCDAQDFLFLIRNTTAQDATIVCTAGAGSGVTKTLTGPNEFYGWDGKRALFDSGDSGDTELTVVCTNVSLSSLMICDVPRATLANGEDVAQYQDPTYAAIAVWQERAIAASTTAGPKNQIQEIIDAWDNYHRQAMAWSVHAPTGSTNSANQLTVAAGAGWTDPFGGVAFKHRARQRSSENTRAYDCWAYTKCDSGGSYQIRITSTNPGPGANSTITSGNLTNTSWAWTQLSTVLVDATADATLLFEMDATDFDCDITALSIYEE
jgi:hypothetical protein